MTGIVCVMAGSGQRTITVLGGTFENNVITPTDALAGYRVERDGDISFNGDGTGGAYVDGADWIVPKSATIGDDYEVRATLNSGAVTSGTTGSWLALTSNQTWEVARTSDTPGTNTANLTIEIRRASDGAVLDSDTVVLSAIVGV